MRLTILGKSPSWPDAGGACSGYLVQGGGVCVLIDCGPGVFAQLRRTGVDYAAVDAILLSHGHADHVLDLVPYASALVYGPRATARRIPLHLHPGDIEALGALSDGAGMSPEHPVRAFEAVEHPDAGDAFAIGGLDVRLARVPHPLPCWAVDVTERSTGARFTFSGDCAPNDALVELARDTPLLLVEATVPQRLEHVHLTPRQAGVHARLARARRVVLTHFSDESPRERWLSEGAAGFGGEVALAAGGAVYDLP